VGDGWHVNLSWRRVTQALTAQGLRPSRHRAHSAAQVELP
jgi:hypothetical protein